MRRKQKPSAAAPVSDRLREIAEGEPLTWPTDDSTAAPHEDGASAGKHLRDEALGAQAAQQLAGHNQPFLL